MPPSIAPRAIFAKNRLTQIPRIGIFSRRGDTGNVNKSWSPIAFFPFFSKWWTHLRVNGCTYTSCLVACMGACKSAWAHLSEHEPKRAYTHGFIPPRGQRTRERHSQVVIIFANNTDALQNEWREFFNSNKKLLVSAPVTWVWTVLRLVFECKNAW